MAKALNQDRPGRPFWALPGLPQLFMLALILLLSYLNSPQFFSVTIKDGRLFGSIIDVFYRGAPVAILALGMTPVIATGGIDLSVGAVIAIAGAVAASLAQTDMAGWQIISLALITGLGCGLWNGALVAFLGIQPFVATLILMVSGRGVAQMITQGKILTFNNPGVDFISRSAVMAVPTAIIIMVAVLALGTLVLRGTALGMFVEAAGVNKTATTNVGVKTSAVLAAVYMWCGLCASIAGLIIVSDIRGADANNAGLWLEMDAILAVVIGGTSLLGGRFSLGFSVVGALIIQAMNTGILLSGFKPELNYIVKALVVLAVLCAQSPALRGALQSMGKGRGGKGPGRGGAGSPGSGQKDAGDRGAIETAPGEIDSRGASRGSVGDGRGPVFSQNFANEPLRNPSGAMVSGEIRGRNGYNARGDGAGVLPGLGPPSESEGEESLKTVGLAREAASGIGGSESGESGGGGSSGWAGLKIAGQIGRAEAENEWRGAR